MSAQGEALRLAPRLGKNNKDTTHKSLFPFSRHGAEGRAFPNSSSDLKPGVEFKDSWVKRQFVLH